MSRAGSPTPGSFALDRADVSQRVDKALAAFLAAQTPDLDAVGLELGPIADAVSELLHDDGARLRSTFCYWGWRGAGGADTDEIVAAASCLELLRAAETIYDDLASRSRHRRGGPSTHQHFASLHRGAARRGDADAFGHSAAVLVGDLCLVWADLLLRTSGLAGEVLRRARPSYDRVRAELMAGRYVELLDQARGHAADLAPSPTRQPVAARVRHRVEYPLRLGAAMAGGAAEVARAYTAYGRKLGVAVALREQMQGVSGDRSPTAQPVGAYVETANSTLLPATTPCRAASAPAAVLRRYTGDPALDARALAALRTVMVETGAVDAVERLVADLCAEAVAVACAAPVDDTVRAVLAEFAVAVTTRPEGRGAPAERDPTGTDLTGTDLTGTDPSGTEDRNSSR